MYKHDELFPFKIDLLGSVYVVDYVEEDRNRIVIVIGLYNQPIIRYVFKKDYEDGYVNVVFLRNIICRNLETHMYQKELNSLHGYLSDETIIALYHKYWRQGLILDK